MSSGMAFMIQPPWARATMDATDIQPRDSCSQIRQYSKMPRPRPPYCSGIVMPKYPISAILSRRSMGISASGPSRALATGSTSFMVNSRAASRIIWRSSVM